jgi:hypothetical protein
MQNAILAFCCSRDNSNSGFESNGIALYYGCIAYGNSDDGIEGLHQSLPSGMINCVVDGNTDDGVLLSSHADLTGPFILGCRITNHSGSGDIGLNANSEPLVVGWSYFEDNDGDNIQNKAAAYGEIPLEGGAATSNIEDQSLTDQGYVDPTNHDFSTDYDSGHATQNPRRRAITVPWS